MPFFFSWYLNEPKPIYPSSLQSPEFIKKDTISLNFNPNFKVFLFQFLASVTSSMFGAAKTGFGAAAPAGGAFGAAATTSAFGAAATNTFGAPAATPAFGAPQQQQPGAFGAQPQPSAFGQPAAGGGLFGAAQVTSKGLFF